MNRNTFLLAMLLSTTLLVSTETAQATEQQARVASITASALDHPKILDILKPENFLDELMYDDDVLEAPVVTPLARNRIEHAGRGKGLRPKS